MAKFDPIQVLDTAQTNGTVFRFAGGPYWVVMTNHNGGTWNLQYRSPHSATTWTNVNGVNWTSSRDRRFNNTPRGLEFRLSGGTAGARAWICLART